MRICRVFGWTWDYVERCVTMERLEAIQRSLDVVPADYEMVAFVAYANGFKPAKVARGKGNAGPGRQAETQETDSLSLGQLIQLFPDGKVKI